MGHLVERVKLSWEKSITVDMLVDTGATYSMIPEALARKVGVVRAPRGAKLRVSLADGRRKSYEAGAAIFTVSGREGPSMVVIGDVAEPILGVETLECSASPSIRGASV